MALLPNLFYIKRMLEKGEEGLVDSFRLVAPRLSALSTNKLHVHGVSLACSTARRFIFK